MTRRTAAALTLVLLTGVAGCGSAEASPAPKPPNALVVIDADEYGAIVADGRRAEFRGVRRDGTIAWRSPQAATAPDAVACVGPCPDALLAGNPAGQNGDRGADPRPELIADGHREPVGGTALTGQVKRTVLTAANAEDYLVTTGTPGHWRLDAVRPGTGTVQTPIPGFRATWTQTADGRRGLAVVSTADPARSAVLWFTRATDGWHAAASVPVRGSSACLAPDGSRAMLLGARPALRHRDGRTQPISDLDFASDCALTSAGGIVGQYGQHNDGRTVRLRAFGADGTVVWRANLPGTARVTADPESARVAYATAGVATEIDLVTGKVVRVIRAAHAARYDGAGNLVVVDEHGAPRWLSPAAR